ncbi:ferredoxin--NADP reductase [Hymenobacter busanensis]|uniref:Ferredoxin--NADP reductase n=1 Tax=Hymenobacter busanensis TaxID=2607656 RepID=A0A7L4ZX78_9BACT|nr:ferredoxin--NADP reductase [Hymenobacter busanensis]KAA9333456.1 ferredoxin--NADP reductase [Hymenobacter busanensis]QHJ07861.1 2Fe-2S iron-sulfur cluster binding domain-containing protein [Hymenobacter busanensis]
MPAEAATIPHSPSRTLRISAIRSEAPDAKTFFLEPTDGLPLPYQAGQYLTLVRPAPEAPHAVRRSYSISSAPVLNEPLAITVKRVPNGLFSRLLVDRAQPGDLLVSSGVGGFFTLPANAADYQQLILLAAGSGITPLFALLKTALHGHQQLRVLLVYSNRTPADAIFHDALHQLGRQFPARLHIEWLFSNDPDLNRAHLHKELLKTLVRQHVSAPLAATLAYLCGPLNYMRMGTYGLRELGLPRDNLRRELFNTEAATVPHTVPPDTAAHRVTVQLRGQAHTFEAEYPRTILQAARAQGLVLPYSCEAGRCGNCVARCTAGQVWMSVNEVLTERDLSRGLVLTCTGYPVGGDVQLEIGT